MNPDSSARLPDTGPDLDEFDPQGVELGSFEFCAFQMSSRQEKQTVRKDMEVEPELIGKKPVTAHSIGFELEFQLFDPVLDISPEHVDVVIDPFRLETKIGDHKPLIRTLFGILGLGNHPARAFPRVSPIPKGPKESLLCPSLAEPTLGSSQKMGPLGPQPIIGNETDHIMDMLFLTESIKSGNGKASIGPQDDLNSPIGTLEPLDDPLEHSHRAMGGMGITRPKHTGDGKTRQAIEVKLPAASRGGFC